MSAPFARGATVVVLAVCLMTLAGCGGGDSEPEVVTETETVTVADPGSTDTTETADSTFTDTTSTGAPDTVDVGEAAVWNGDAFTVSDVETGDTRPVPDLLGERGESENGVFLSFKITPADSNSGIFSFDFHGNMQIRGGDGVVYDDVFANLAEQDFMDEDDFLAWVDIPEAAVSGAILEVFDGLHTIDPDPSNPFADLVPDPAYATRVALGL